MAKNKRGLNPRQQRFAEEYVLDCNASQAALRAGYAPLWAASNAQRLTRNDCVKTEIIRLQGDLRAKTNITAKNVVENFVMLRDQAIKDGKTMAAIKANELLGKHLGVFDADNRQKSGLKLVINAPMPPEHLALDDPQARPKLIDSTDKTDNTDKTSNSGGGEAE